jgi:uncharacterized protein YkwD
MYSRIIHITLLAVVLFFAFSVSPSLSQDVPSQYEEDLLQLINEARENPLIVATSLGMDADQVLRDLPELEDILTNGLPPLIFNENLYAAAGAHTRDMLENNYYSHISLDGRTYDDRIVESGYYPVVTGESLGMLGFYNFIQPADAVELIFENMFRDELDPARTERRNILDSDLEKAGIGFGAGTFKIDGSIYNVYLTTCDFATSVFSVIELELFDLINQAREDPLAMASSLGMDPDQILENLPELTEILTEGIPPLSFNENLYAAATAHVWDMLENCYFSYVSLDGRTVDDRIMETGYIPLVTGEIMRLLATKSFVEPAEGARTHFEKIFMRELSPDCTDRNILNPEFREVGISFLATTPDIWVESDCIYNEYYNLLLAADFGTSVIQGYP